MAGPYIDGADMATEGNEVWKDVTQKGSEFHTHMSNTGRYRHRKIGTQDASLQVRHGAWMAGPAPDFEIHDTEHQRMLNNGGS